MLAAEVAGRVGDDVRGQRFANDYSFMYIRGKHAFGCFSSASSVLSAKVWSTRSALRGEPVHQTTSMCIKKEDFNFPSMVFFYF